MRTLGIPEDRRISGRLFFRRVLGSYREVLGLLPAAVRVKMSVIVYRSGVPNSVSLVQLHYIQRMGFVQLKILSNSEDYFIRIMKRVI